MNPNMYVIMGTLHGNSSVESNVEHFDSSFLLAIISPALYNHKVNHRESEIK